MALQVSSVNEAFLPEGKEPPFPYLRRERERGFFFLGPFGRQERRGTKNRDEQKNLLISMKRLLSGRES